MENKEGVFDMCEGDKSCLGFMELLGVHDYWGYNSVFDTIHIPSIIKPHEAAPGPNPAVVAAGSLESQPEGLNQPATPNSPSFSSASSEALNDKPQQVEVLDKEEADQENKSSTTKKELKAKKTNQKRQREPRIAFMTKSEVDHLEDGYRWRKYGQKAVKNSPFARSYYRCTTISCNVKKRVERSFDDPSIVVTTYEGQHTHPSPLMSRPTFPAPESASGFSNSIPLPMRRSAMSLYNQQPNSLASMGLGYNGGIINNRLGSGLLFKDHGLLQDIVTSQVIKEE